MRYFWVLLFAVGCSSGASEIEVVQGEQGATGPQGERGVQGVQGVQGVRGVQGEKGLQGDIGNTGPVGPSGPQGEPGEDGSDSIPCQVTETETEIIIECSESTVSFPRLNTVVPEMDICVWNSKTWCWEDVKTDAIEYVILYLDQVKHFRGRCYKGESL